MSGETRTRGEIERAIDQLRALIEDQRNSKSYGPLMFAKAITAALEWVLGSAEGDGFGEMLAGLEREGAEAKARAN